MKYLIITLVMGLFLVNLQANGENEASGLDVGTVAPLFSAVDADGKTVTLQQFLNKGPVVMVFYRGQWCPVCNKHLKTLQDSLEQINALGATVLTISPQKPEFLNEMAEKTKAKFPLLYDENYSIMDSYKVTFTPPAATTLMYNVLLGAELKKSQSDESQRLPVPATYIINTDGVIVWRQFDPNYKNRSTVKDIKEALANL